MDKAKKINTNKIIAIIFVAVIMIFFVSIIVRFILSAVFGISLGSNASVDENSQVPSGTDWSEQYPFSDEYRFKYLRDDDGETVEVKQTKYEKYSERIGKIKDRIEEYSTTLLMGRMKFVELNATVNKLVGMKLITGTDSVVVMKNGQLTYESTEQDTGYAAESTAWFADILSSKGIDLMYVQSPSKENKFDNQLPDGVTDYYNINADKLLEKLGSKGVRTVDLRPMLNAEARDYSDCFFRTDHHWKPTTGVWAAGKIAEALNESCGYSIDPSLGDISNYNVKIYKNYCLGTQGKKVTLNYTDPEDFQLVYPKKDMSFTANYSNENKITGGYTKALLDMKELSRIDYYNLSTYSTYLYGNKALRQIKNNDLHDGKRLLIIGDSFCHCVAPCLATGIEYLDFLDIRYFNGSVINYIEQTRPDTVIINYNPSSINSDSSLGGTFNFE